MAGKIKKFFSRFWPVSSGTAKRQTKKVLNAVNHIQESVQEERKRNARKVYKLNQRIDALNIRNDLLDSRISQLHGEFNRKIDEKFKSLNEGIDQKIGLELSQMGENIGQKFDSEIKQLSESIKQKLDAELRLMGENIGRKFDSEIKQLDACIDQKFKKNLQPLKEKVGENFKTFERKVGGVERNIRTLAYFKDYEYYKNLNPAEYRRALEEWYEKRMGCKLDLDAPKTFNEKIQWLKLYDSTPIKTRLADKYQVRSWVKEKIGEEYLVPLLGVWERYDEIDFNMLPERFVLKCNHGYAWNMIVTDKSKIDHALARNNFERWIHTNFAFAGGLELHYKDIPPRIIAEEYMENNNNDLYDYKIWCFDGKPAYINFLSDRKTGLQMAFYDTDWNLLPFIWGHQRNKELVLKPENLDEMLRLASILSQGFCHVRVDFYVLNNGSIKFGEMTFTSTSGTCKWDPPEYNLILGDKIKLPSKS